ncbi:glycosyl transferase family group 2-domain-containing protein [Cyathus striatus]|nr:glycosyl transferase family group 2-domain-containing protein [Cyathus striatus]
MSVVTIHNSDYDLWDAWLHKIYEATQQHNWFMPTEDIISTGVCMRVEEGYFRVFPYENQALVPFEAAVRKLNPVVAVKLRNASIHAALRKIAPEDDSIYIEQNTRIQVIDTIDLLPMAEKDQCAAFIVTRRALPSPLGLFHENLLPLWQEFEEKLIKFVWRTQLPSRAFSSGESQAELNEKHAEQTQVQEVTRTATTTSATSASGVTEKPRPASKKSWWNWRLGPHDPNAAASSSSDDPEKGPGKRKERKLMLYGPFYAGCGAALSTYFMSSGVSVLLQEFALDGNPARFGLLVTLPIIYSVSLFFCLQLVGNLSLIFGPPNPEIDNNLPHITIQMPVYKESLELTIAPSVFSVKKAMQTYARQGGTSAIFICDDGMQLISEDDRKERQAFYANHNIGWTARPGHSGAPDGFKRAGKFKKASNMNYGLYLSLKLEKFLTQLIEEGAEDTHEECLEDRAMKMAQEEMFEESGRRFQPWCSNGKSLRMGEIVLIIDSDTIVPEDCFRDAAREMGESPDVAIIQHESDVMQVAHHYFENGITHFTRRINRCISLGCANGEVAPFVGHNAFLRWSAANVSEDFDLALRLLLNGYTLRWATYSNGGFKEGVSLTVVDELARWQKYAYGCNEIIFNPLIHWWRKGPISQQLRGFIWSRAPVHYKIGMTSYIWYCCLDCRLNLNYLLLGLAPQIDRFYLHSFEIFLACTVIFPGLGNLGYTLLEYRLGHRNFFGALVENLRWIPFFLFFFGGLSIHLSTALLAHMFSYNMTWGSTVKEVERSTFWIEVPRIWERFKLSFIICFMCIAMMVVFTTDAVPFEWQIPGWNWALIIPLALVVGCHLLLPIVLNPWLMIFSY